MYCATSIIDGLEVDHIFEVEDDDKALLFAAKQGWGFIEEADTEVTFKPWVPEIVH